MGGCTSSGREELVVIKKHDLNENHTKHFEKGENYYTFNREDK
jgi:hypothetical protein